MFRPSGIRLGTPAMTTRGLREEQMPQIAEWMKQAIDARDDELLLSQLKDQVTTFLKSYQI